MLRRFVRFVVRAALVVAIGAAVAIAVRRIRAALSPQLPPGRDPWPPIARVEPVAERPAPAAVVEVATEVAAVEPAVDEQPVRWVPPASPAECPETHPVKVKMSSRLFHLPGMLAYTRTHPDRCYDCEESAVADGFTRAKR
jgi:hypothetical protein